jgi:two-component system sensor histidine kinase ChvG
MKTGGSRPKRRLLSPLTRRILAINLVAPALLVAGLLYVDEYRDALVEAQVDALFAQGELMAGALGEAAIAPADGPPELYAELARGIVRRLGSTSGTRVRLYDAEGYMVADSQMLEAAGREVLILPLPAPEQPPTLGQRIWHGIDDLMDRIQGARGTARYRERRDADSETREVATALTGEPAALVSEGRDGQLRITIALPVTGLRTVVGALALSVDSTLIDARVREERLGILRLLALALIVTVVLSLYLAGTIARPIRRLALAAQRVRGSGRQRAQIPVFPRRSDEISELADALRAMTEALYGRIDAIAAFAADVAHELKNPLTSIRSALETLERTTDPERRARLMDIVQHDIRRMDRLISDISDSSRLDAELARAEARPIDLAAFMDAMVAAYREVAGEGAPAIELSFANLPLRANAIETRLGQVLRNLLDNAMSFSPPGGMVRVRARRDGGQIVITVDDEGPGIPPDKLEAVFDRFYSERPKGEAFGRHSGLGLSIARQIVTALGGTLNAANRTDDGGKVLGARFAATLPALD